MNKIPLCNDYLHHFVLSFLTSGLVEDQLTVKFKLRRKEQAKKKKKKKKKKRTKERKKKEKVESWLLAKVKFRIPQCRNADK